MHGLHRRVLQIEHHLEEWRMAQVALRVKFFNQLFKRDVLVGIGRETCFFYFVQKLAEGKLAGALDAGDFDSSGP